MTQTPVKPGLEADVRRLLEQNRGQLVQVLIAPTTATVQLVVQPLNVVVRTYQRSVRKQRRGGPQPAVDPRCLHVLQQRLMTS